MGAATSTPSNLQKNFAASPRVTRLPSCASVVIEPSIIPRERRTSSSSADTALTVSEENPVIVKHDTISTTDKNNDTNLDKDSFKEMLDESLSDIKSTIKDIDSRVADLEKNNNISDLKPSHPKQFLDRIKLGPQLHKTLNAFRTRINADHIFIGSFHNGNESITGIPYYKFDIIAEKFRPDKVDKDIEFAFMYKDADLLRHDLLPAEVVQNGTVHYIIDENGKSPLADVDDIIYRRMIGRDIKQLAVSLLRDPKTGTPSGFVGCVTPFPSC